MRTFILFALLFVGSAFGATVYDSLAPQTTLFNQNAHWAGSGGPFGCGVTDYCNCINDNDNATYIFATDNVQTRISVSDPDLSGFSTVDSFVYYFIATTTDSAGNDRILPRVYNTNQSEFCNAAQIDLNETITTYTRKFTNTATGSDAGTCTGALTEVKLDSLVPGIIKSIGDTIKVYEFWVIVWGDDGGGAPANASGRRRKEYSFNKPCPCQKEPIWLWENNS